MRKKENIKTSTIDEIKRHIRVLNVSVLISLVIIMVMVTRHVYGFMGHIPIQSVLVLFVIMAATSILGMFSAKATSSNAIKAIDKYSGRLRKLLEESREIHTDLYSDVILDKYMDISMKLTGSGACILAFFEDDKLFVKAVKGDSISSLNAGDITLYASGIIGMSLESGEAHSYSGADLTEHFEHETDLIKGEKRSTVCVVPLMINGVPFGALELFKQNGVYTDEDLEILKYFSDQAAISFENSRFHEDEKNFEIHITNMLVSAMENHQSKKGHSTNVATYSLQIASELDMTDQGKETLYKAAILHDIGALRLSRNMSEDEYAMHPQFGYDMLKPISFYSAIAKSVLHHHEWYDGSGYPQGLKGVDIPIESRVIAVAEAFDAIISSSGCEYHETAGTYIAPSNDEFKIAAAKLDSQAGTKFDPLLVKALVKRIRTNGVCDKSDNPLRLNR